MANDGTPIALRPDHAVQLLQVAEPVANQSWAARVIEGAMVAVAVADIEQIFGLRGATADQISQRLGTAVVRGIDDDKKRIYMSAAYLNQAVGVKENTFALAG